MRLASWNVESIRAHTDQVVNWITANDADVVCLQETRASVRTFPRQPFAAAGYALTIAGGKGGQAGVAVASRIPISDVVIGFPGAVAPLNDDRSISFTAVGVRVHTVYAPNGRKVATPAHAIKLAWFSLLASWLELESHDHSRQILIGDLNVAPADIDIWEAHRYRKRNLTSPPERAAFAELLHRAGMVDVVRNQHGDHPVFTWWNRRSDFYESDRGWRLDHLLADPETESLLGTVRIDRAERGRPKSCDHAPLIVDFTP